MAYKGNKGSKNENRRRKRRRAENDATEETPDTICVYESVMAEDKIFIESGLPAILKRTRKLGKKGDKWAGWRDTLRNLKDQVAEERKDINCYLTQPKWGGEKTRQDKTLMTGDLDMIRVAMDGVAIIMPARALTKNIGVR